MSKEVKRYDVCDFFPGITEQAEGPYVTWDDYKALLAENARLESAWHVDVMKRKDELIDMQERENDRVKAELSALLAERDRLREALADLRWRKARAALQGEQP